jgi:hypothetical protein
VLTGKGVTAWRRVLARLTCATATDAAGTPSGAAASPAPQAPDSAAAELVHVLAAVAVALAGT